MVIQIKKNMNRIFFFWKIAECEKSQDIWYYAVVVVFALLYSSLCAIFAVVCELWVCNPRMSFVGTHYLPPETRRRQPLHSPATGNALLEGGATQNRKYQHGQ